VLLAVFVYRPLPSWIRRIVAWIHEDSDSANVETSSILRTGRLKSLRICLLSRYDPLLTRAGTEVYTGRLGLQLARMGQISDAFCAGTALRTTHLNGFCVHSIPDLQVPFLSTLQFNRNIRPIVKQFITDEKVDVVDCQGSGPGAAFAALARAMKNGTRFVYHAHDCVASELDEILKRRLTKDPRFIIKTRLLARYEEKAISVSDLIVSTSEAAKTGIITHYGIAADMIHVVGLGIPDDYALNFRRSEPDPPCFLTFGAGIRRDLQSFLRALALLRRTHRINGRAIIVRDENRRHRALAQKLNLDVTFYNSVTDDFLKGLYASCTALFMPSFREGFCLPVIEAGAFAKPTIASRAGSLPDLIQDGVNGILMKDLRPDTIADAMRLIVSDIRLREKLGSNAEELAGNYRISNTTRQLIELYNSKLS